MKILSGLYFPGTRLPEDSLYSLLCLLDRVDFYQVVEGKEADPPGNDGAAYWRGQVVLPLGKDRDRFLAMIRDIKSHAADFYGSYLSALSDNALVDRDESSVWQLVANLHGENNQSDHDPVLTEKIWQARMVLQLAEILADERAELVDALAEFGRREQAVLDALKGEFDEPAEGEGLMRTADLGVARGPDGVQTRHLLKAWSTLFLMDANEHPLMVTDSLDSAEIIFDAWEELSGGKPQLLVEVAMPSPASSEAMVSARSELGEARTGICAALQEIVGPEVFAGTADLNVAAEHWRATVMAMERGPKWCFAIYLLAGQPLRKVWGRVSGLAVGQEAGGSQHVLLGVIRPMA